MAEDSNTFQYSNKEVEHMFSLLSDQIDLVDLVPLTIKFQGKSLDVKNRRPMFSPVFKKLKSPKKDVYMCGRQIGKAQALDTPIATPTGWTTIGDLNVGDNVFSEDGSVTAITSITPIMYNHDCYKIVFDDGEEIVADAEHLWKVSRSASQKDRHGNPRIVNTLELIDLMPRKKKSSRFSIQSADPLKLPDAALPINPFILGYWLGDGCSRHGSITSGVRDLYESRSNLEAEGAILGSNKPQNEGRAVVFKIDGLTKKLKSNQLYLNKHIPSLYLRGSFNQRLSLLQGLMDTDGSVRKTGGCEITQKRKNLAINIQELLSTLGVKSRLREKWVKIGGQNPRKELYWTVGFATHLPVFRLSRKAASHALATKNNPKNLRHYIKSITKVDSVPVRCVLVEHPSHMYLCGRSMIPTHNSVTAGSAMVMDCVWRDHFRVLYVAPMAIYTQRMHSMFMLPMIRGCQLPWKIQNTTECINNVLEKSFLTGSHYVGISAYNNAANALGLTADRICWDEVQDLNGDLIPQIKEVIGTSDYRYESYFGTARSVDNTLTKLFENSTQNLWHMECDHCHHINVPNIAGDVLSMIRIDGICCVKCGKPIDVEKGQWRRSYEYDPISRDAEGYQIPQIIVKDRITPHERYIDTIYNKLHGSSAYSEARFCQEVLGIPTSQGGVPITQSDISKASVLDVDQHSIPAVQRYQRVAGGVDWGGSEITSFTVGTILGYHDGKFDVLGAIRPTGLPDEQRHIVVGQYLNKATSYTIQLVGADAGFVGSVQNPNLSQVMNKPVASISYGTTRSFMTPHTNNHFTVDRTTLLYIVITLVRQGKIRFPKGPWFETFTKDFFAIYTEDVVNAQGTTMRRYARYSDRADDFVHSLGYALFVCSLGLVDLPEMVGMQTDTSINAPYVKDIGVEMGFR